MTKRRSLLATAVVATVMMMSAAPSAAQIEASEGPVGVSVGANGGAGAAQASCDLLATACAGAAAAVLYQEASAEGTLPVFGTGSITVSADFGVAVAAHGVRVILTGEGDGETLVTETHEEEKIVKGADKCQWYNPADWFGNCDPDETVRYHVDKQRPNACPALYSVFLDPSLAGDWKADSCSSSSGADVVCMTAKASANALSNTGDAKAGPVEATNCDPEAAIRMAQLMLEPDYVQEIGSVDEIEEPYTPHVIRFKHLPIEVQIEWRERATETMHALLAPNLQENYSGPEEGREIIIEATLNDLATAIEEFDGEVTVSFAPYA